MTTNEEITNMIKKHNEIRKKYGVCPIVYDPQLSLYSQTRADQISNSKELKHDLNCPYGENLYWSSSQKTDIVNAAISWINEESNWKENKKPSGHFTQCIWNNSVKIGIGKSVSDFGTVVVCNYNPPGNIIGQNPF